ncbi:hypothetical protein OG594_02765 [Streptomyces sp. NBC_01214]|uniref:hypothetical protein n=1 Tax=Streptomyces sp. NBC_01214 TaxID=2903777 RepID=UPI00224D84B1|nr:hypothetical protein [Streptomyces sp. NBC_01214]MCX4800604.1 hypothetical protein [Streptomyces sp. NBC_01214]
MSRRTRTHTAMGAAPNVHIPRQRGHRHGPQIIVVVSDEPTLTARVTAATGRWVWKHRRTWAPTGLAILLLPVTGVVHLITPWAALVAAPAVAVPLAVLGWKANRAAAACTPAERARRASLAVLALTSLTWFSLALWFGPAAPVLMGLWSLITLHAQITWLFARLRTSHTTKGTR